MHTMILHTVILPILGHPEQSSIFLTFWNQLATKCTSELTLLFAQLNVMQDNKLITLLCFW